MALFSERSGYKSPKEIIQSESMDDDLRTGLWNCVSLCLESTSSPISYFDDYFKFIIRLWADFFKRPIDTIEYSCSQNYSFIKSHFMNFEWFEVYDFLEFLYDNYPKDTKHFLYSCNKILERELSAYRFVSGKIVKIISDIEISEINEAISSPFDSINNHFNRALELLSDKKNPDYRNSIKESISAVESMCRIISQNEKVTLGEALKLLEQRGILLHPSLKDSFNKLYGYTNDEKGIRHSLFDEKNSLSFEDAKFMLVTCASFVNYLKIKLEKSF